MRLLNWTQTYGPLISLIAVVVEAIALVWLGLLERATHKLQKEVEADRQRVEVYVRIFSATHPGPHPRIVIGLPDRAGGRDSFLIRFSNLNDAGVFLERVAVALVFEGKRFESADIMVEKIVPAFETTTVAVTDELLKVVGLSGLGPVGDPLAAASSEAEIKCAYHARGKNHEQWFKQTGLRVLASRVPIPG